MTGPDSAATCLVPSGHRTLTELFAACVRQYPDVTSVIHNQSRLTYAELNALSDYYAHALKAEGVGRGTVVPVLMRPDLEMIGVLLAIIKCGAAYTVMDPKWPASRHTALMERLAPPVVVTREDTPWPRVWAPPGCDPATLTADPVPALIDPEDPFLILFTSGSTGAPKGVILPHRTTARLFTAGGWNEIGPGTTMAQVSAPSWDGFALDCWGPLVSGGTTVLVDEHILVPASLRALHAEHGVNAIFLTPSLFNVLVEEDVQSFAGIDTVILGGEKASSVHSRCFIESHPKARLLNIYGPSECGVLATAHVVTPEDCDAPAGIPLGRAIPFTEVEVLDGTRVCGRDEVGEICIGGPAVATGYMHDPDLTARQFVDLDIDGARKRMYRTGDLGHWSGDGLLRFNGRADLQVKVRGNRIEPEEIELAVSRIAGIALAAVVPLRRDGLVDGLVLCFTSPGGGVSEAGLRAELSRRLPSYLLPRRIRRLNELPLLANGKLDRLRLEAIADAAESVSAAIDS
jgi:mycobactin peptide synthetase MbtE